ncbi:tyrosine-type recombinase/integrase [Cupriavidus basilensis]|uniref:tyrosine-type recombinase/integrase n=1 Tax=Cupriavidus basilensis TaxID=68895 RepID=UPI0023E8E4D6|nr:tyrosine-type recombinase/integrase [Cupriavidus basilensis]MDF3886027.1 tyrosine-type recombinase/integrase [Cupriavidus basilensis]
MKPVIVTPRAQAFAPHAHRAFTIAELNALLASPVYTKRECQVKTWGDVAFWLPLLGLYTGARLRELCRLQLSDLREPEGLWCLRIHEQARDDEAASLAGIRHVPLHSHLLQCGLPAYVAGERTARGSGLLFAQLATGRSDYRAIAFSRWFSRYVRQELGFGERPLTFCSFRHTFAAFAGGTPRGNAHIAILGGTPATRRGRHAGGKERPTLAQLVEVMQQLVYPELAIGHLERTLP